MFEEKFVKQYVSMLKKGSSEEELKSVFCIDSMLSIAKKYYGFKYIVTSLQKIESFLVWQDIPKDDIVLTNKSLFVKLNNISVRMFPYWGGVTLVNFVAPFQTKSYLQIRCNEERVYDFLKEANEALPGILKRFESLKQEMETMMKKPIPQVLFEYEKKEKARSVVITSIETLAKQKLKPYNVENVKFDHKRYMSHIFADFKDGKQQIDITVKHKDLQKAVETIDNAGRIIEMIQKNDVVVRGKVGYEY